MADTWDPDAEFSARLRAMAAYCDLDHNDIAAVEQFKGHAKTAENRGKTIRESWMSGRPPSPSTQKKLADYLAEQSELEGRRGLPREFLWPGDGNASIIGVVPQAVPERRTDAQRAADVEEALQQLEAAADTIRRRLRRKPPA